MELRPPATAALILTATAIVASCTVGAPSQVSTSPAQVPPTATLPPAQRATETLSPGMATLVSKWSTEESQATPTVRGPRPTHAPSNTPQPDLANLEGRFTRDGIQDKITFIQETFGSPSAVLYRNGGRGYLVDYGDFTNDVDFSLLLQYPEEPLVVEVDSNHGPFTQTAKGRGTLQICLSSPMEYGYETQITIHHRPRLPQQDLLYRDLSVATGLGPEAIMSLLGTSGRCLPVPVSLPAPALHDTPGLRASDPTLGTPECTLPCWNGLTPGKSIEADIQAFFERLGVQQDDIRLDLDRNEYQAYIAIYPFEFPATPPSVVVKTANGVVRAITIFGFDYYDFMTIAHLLYNLGSPEEIGLTDWGGQGMLDYDLMLHYRSLRTAIEVSGETLRFEPQICNSPDSQFRVSVIIYNEPSDPYAVDFYETHNGIPDLSTALDKSPHEILAELSVPGACIALPAESIEP